MKLTKLYLRKLIKEVISESYQPSSVKFEGENAILTFKCVNCKKEKTITVPKSGYEAWKKGEYVQNAFRNLPSSERELFVSGTCSKCWNEMFGTLDTSSIKGKHFGVSH